MPTMKVRLLTTLEALSMDAHISTSSRSIPKLGIGVSQLEQFSDVGENHNRGNYAYLGRKETKKVYGGYVFHIFTEIGKVSGCRCIIYILMVPGQLKMEVLCSIPTKRMTTYNYIHRYALTTLLIQYVIVFSI